VAAKRIRRNHEREAWFLGGIVLCLVIGVWVAVGDYQPIVRVMVPAVDAAFAALLYVWMRKTTGVVECPSCGGTTHNVPVTDNAPLLCQFCGNFAVAARGAVDVPALSYVSARPAFAAILPRDNVAWPEVCLLCDRPSTRTSELKIATPALQIIRVPNCEEHVGGAVLMRPDDTPHLVIAFRRYGAYKRFAEANGSTPYQL
jgi:hypothetical protein